MALNTATMASKMMYRGTSGVSAGCTISIRLMDSSEIPPPGISRLRGGGAAGMARQMKSRGRMGAAKGVATQRKAKIDRLITDLLYCTV